MTLYQAVHRPTGTRNLPRKTMTRAMFDFFLLKDSQDWYVVPVDLPPLPSEEEQQKFLAQIYESIPTFQPTEAQLNDMEAEYFSEGRVDRPKSPNIHE